jgi:hypothetical protein
MGLGAFLWSALSDRSGTRVVVLVGGALLGQRHGYGTLNRD